jgi:hypothetical protein
VNLQNAQPMTLAVVLIACLNMFGGDRPGFKRNRLYGCFRARWDRTGEQSDEYEHRNEREIFTVRSHLIFLFWIEMAMVT